MKSRFVAVALAACVLGGVAAPAHAEAGRPVDQRSSVKPLFEMSSAENSSQYWSFATDEELKEKWDEAVRMGFFSPTIEKIYDLEIGDVTWQERQAANEGKFEAKPTANEVLGSSLKWDAARGQQLGTALNWWIALGVIGTVLTAGVAAFLSGAFERVPALQNLL